MTGRVRTTGRRILCAAVVVLPLVGCGDDDPTGPRSGIRYELTSVSGGPVPAIVDSSQAAGRPVRLHRVVARALRFLSADSAQYTVVSDVVERATGGGFNPVSTECASMRVAWRRAGANVLLDFTGFPAPAVPVDTLRVSGRAIVQRLREGDPAGDGYVLRYLPRDGTELLLSCEVTE